MKKIFYPIMFLILFNIPVFCLDIDYVLDKVEKNLTHQNIIYDARMDVKDDNNDRTMMMKIYVKDDKNVLIEILQSTEGNSSRFLKKDKQMYLYIPAAGRSVLIKGHMLKEGFMGGSFTYEDMSENRKLRDIYDIAGEETDSFYVIEMIAKVDDAPYKKKKSYIRKDIYLPVKEEIYSSADRLLKEMIIEEYKTIDGMNVPSKIIMKDNLQKNKSTVITYEKIEFSKKIPDNYFTKAYLER